MSNDVRLIDGCAPDWCCTRLDGAVQRQAELPWCVPACVAMLSALGAPPLSQREAARRLRQHDPPAPLDWRDRNAYAALERVLHGFDLHEAIAPDTAVRLTHDRLRRFGRALVSSGGHAVLCVGTCADSVDWLGNRQPAWRVIDPWTGTLGWRALAPGGHAVDFAFAAC